VKLILIVLLEAIICIRIKDIYERTNKMTDTVEVRFFRMVAMTELHHKPNGDIRELEICLIDINILGNIRTA
jgi:hypothetical protein